MGMTNTTPATETDAPLAPCGRPNRCMMSKRCEPCTMLTLSTMRLELVELWHEHGVISTDARDAYRHVWAISATRSKAYDHWMGLPDGEDAQRMAKILVEILPSGRGYA